MRVLLVSNNFPPEVNALANRAFEHAGHWVRRGVQVEVLTDVPHYPEGKIYTGYANRRQKAEIQGIGVLRVPMYVAENRGKIRRTLSYLSFMASAMIHGRRVAARPDVVVATSPQFFAPLAGLFIARRFRVPFVLEIRDLWPASIVAVGALRRGLIIRALEVVERFLYSNAKHIVVVTNSFKRILAERGVPADKITVLKNGVSMSFADACHDEGRLAAIRREHGLEGKFVVSYIGTIGMAHKVEVLLEAASLCEDGDTVFMVVGAGAERAHLAKRIEERGLSNVRLVDKQPRESVPCYVRVSDVSFVHLRNDPLFRTVIPSKMFEAMLMQKPVILGVDGEARDILEAAGAGIAVPPEDPHAVLDAARTLKNDLELCRRMGQNGEGFVRKYHDRDEIAGAYLSLLRKVAGMDSPVGDNHRPAVEAESLAKVG